MRALLLVAGLVVACSRSTGRRVEGDPASSRAASSASVARAPNTPPANTAKATPPPGFVEATVAGAPSLGAGHAVLLVDPEQRRAVPIFIGGTEGYSIELRLAREKAPRPLTHDLLDSTLRELGARVHSARVVKLEDGIYFGLLVLSSEGRTIELDARASDAVALALGAGAPIFLATSVLERAGIPIDSLADGGFPERPPEKYEIRL